MRISFVGQSSRTQIVLLAAAALNAACAAVERAPAAGRLISQDEARHVGLERAWFAQVRLDRSRNQVERAVLADGRLDVLTTAGVVQEFNAQTGETYWIAPVGNPNYPSLGPTASAQFVALINGSTLYVLDRTDGRPVKIRRVGGAPGAAPALARQHVFVPLLNGRVEGYPLDKEIFTPWFYQSFGHGKVPPLTTEESLVWATDSGHLYIGGADKLGVRSRLETGCDIVAPPAYRKPYVFVAATSGEVFAIDEQTGRKRWKYATGYPVTRAPAVVGERVFVTSQQPALHCIDSTSGLSKWEAPKITQFAAASRNRVYGVGELGALVVLDAATGALTARMPTDGTIKALVNDQTDRLYLVSDDGAVQCLREIGAKEPLYHRPPADESEATTRPAKTEAMPSVTGQAVEAPPGAKTAPAADEGGDPFGGTPVEDDNENAEGAGNVPPERPQATGGFGVEENPFGEDSE
jgi:outer membrane protein assembly factor BamB